uniref:(northern house mosquito) hypothetical protein n=1 Tax=Culex pipiens TaxID=7175 RepID=A0A8D8N4H0_CULPI
MVLNRALLSSERDRSCTMLSSRARSTVRTSSYSRNVRNSSCMVSNMCSAKLSNSSSSRSPGKVSQTDPYGVILFRSCSSFCLIVVMILRVRCRVGSSPHMM